MIITVPVRKGVISSTIERSLKKRCLDNITEPATAVVNGEDVLEALDAAESSLLSLEAVVDQEA